MLLAFAAFISGVETQVKGSIQIPLVREALGALNAKFAAVGNHRVEVSPLCGGGEASLSGRGPDADVAWCRAE